jgi:hypothetical protein
MRPLEARSPPSFPRQPNRRSSKPAVSNGQPLMRHELLLVIGLVRGRCLPGEAPTRGKQILLVRRPSGPMMLFVRPSAPNRCSPLASLAVNLPSAEP